MSIINDALKKAQMRLKRPKKDQVEPPKSQVKPEPPEVKASNVYEKMYQEKEIKLGPSNRQVDPHTQASSEKPSRNPVQKIFITFGSFIFLIMSLYVCFLVLSNNDRTSDYFQSIKRSSRFTKSRNLPTPQPPRSYQPTEMVLNGISLVDGTRVALINDQIYRVGDIIQGKKIILIEANSVQIQDDLETITIEVR